MTMRVRLAWGMVAVGVCCGLTTRAGLAGTNRWDRSLAVGVTLTDGNSQSTLATGSAKVERDWEHQAVRVGVDATYGKTQTETDDGRKVDEVTAQNVKGSANYKWKTNPVYYYGDATLLHDKVSEVRYRLIVGPGVGIYLYEGKDARLGVEAGVAYVKEDMERTADDDYLAYRLGERYECRISATAKAWQSVEYLPKADDLGNYLLAAELGVEAALSARTNLRLVAQDKYDSEPADNLEKNDLIVTAGVGMNF